MEYVYTATAGGLGDTIYNYLSSSFDIAYFSTLKKSNPECLTKVYVWSSNSQSAELLLHNPNIDEVVFNPFDPNWHEITLSIKNHFRTLTAEEKNHQTISPEIYLDDKESDEAKKIIENKPFAVIHPFAGTDERSWNNKIDIFKVIDILKSYKIQTVIVGGSSVRHGENRFIEESISINDPAVCNLVNKYSSRLHAYLTNRANYFIGSVSAYSVAAASGNVKSILFGPKYSQKELLYGNGPFELFRKNNTNVLDWNNYQMEIVNFLM